MTGILDLVKDLELDLSEVDTAKILKKMEVSDWKELREDLEAASEANESLRQSIELTLKIIDLVIEKGIDLIV